MEVTVLGPVRLRRNGADIELGARLQRLLAALVVAEGSVVSVDRLVEIVWNGDTPRSPDSTLRSYVTRLRQQLDADSNMIQRRRPGYALDLDHDQLDASLFVADLDRAVSHLRTGDATTAAELLNAALARWSGPAMAGLADEAWAQPTAVRLEERRLEATEALIETHLANGMVDVAIATARELAAAQPLRERTRELLMRALYQSGRQAEALREFTAFRRYLAEETGLDPSAELVDLEGRIVRGDSHSYGTTRTLGSYELAERIGEGAYAVVHRAVQPGLERDVAIKIIRAELADLPEFIRRFEVEARTIARIEHPNVVPLYDFWREPGAAYLVMRLLRGGTLQEALRSRGPFSRERVTEVLNDIGGALEHAHRAGVIHRDIRPANLLLDEQGTAYLADFGIAVPTAVVDDLPIASPAYAAPEVLRGEPAGVAADVLSLGVTVFELLTGRLPFADSTDRAELVRRQMSDPLPSVRATRTDLPPAVDEILARATSKAADDRHASVPALVAELQEVLGHQRSPGSARPKRQGEPARPVENPYVGLHAFEEQDADRFHGREALVTELVEAMEQHRLVVVVGPSGSGKSSVVRAGLLPAVRRGGIHGSEEWFVTTMVPGADPIAALEAALLRVAVNPPASLHQQLQEAGGLLRAVRRVLPNDRAQLLVAIDQFEELFTQVADTGQRDRFLTELAAAIDAPRSPLRVVATLRADHYDAPLRHRDIAQLVTDGTVTVRPMAPNELERAIVAPAKQVGVELESALVAELVAGIDERPAALPLLQFALTELFERRAGDVMLLATHLELGGLGGAVARRADRIVDEGGQADQAEARRIFGRLVTIGDSGDDSRRRALRSEFGDEERTAWLLDAFVTARLLSTNRDEATREPSLEIAHESLLSDWPRLREWLDEDREDLRTLHRVATAADAWDSADHDPGELARGTRLVAVEELAARRHEWLNDRESSWFAASTEAAELEGALRLAREERDRRQNRRLRGLLVAASLLLVVAVGAAALAFVLRGEARSEADRAGTEQERADEAASMAVESQRLAEQRAVESSAAAQAEAEAATRAVDARADAEIERLIAQSAAEIATEPDRAILLALEALRRRNDADTVGALHRAIAAEPRLASVHPDPFDTVTLSAVSDDGSTGVTVAAAEGTVVWFDGTTGELSDTSYETGNAVSGVAISGDGSTTAITLQSGELVVLDGTGSELDRLRHPSGAPLLIPALDADGNVVSASIAQSGRLMIAQVATGEPMLTAAVDAALAAKFVELSPDGERLAVGINEQLGPIAQGAVMLFDATSGERVDRFDSDRGVISAVAISADTVVSGYQDGTVEIRSLGDDTVVSIPAHAGFVEAVSIAGDGQVLSAGGGEVRLWSPDGRSTGLPVAVSAEVTSLAMTSEGQMPIARQSEGHMIVDVSGGPLIEASYPDAVGARLLPYLPYYDQPGPGFRSVQLYDLDSGDLASEIDLTDIQSPQPSGAPPFYSTDGEWILTALGRREDDTPIAVTEINGSDQVVFRAEDIFLALFGEPPGPGVFYGFRPESGGERLFGLARNDAGLVRAGWFDLRTRELLAGPLDLEFGGRVLPLADGRVVHGGFVARASIGILPADLDSAPIVVDGTGGLEPFHQDLNTGRFVVGGPGGLAGVIDPDTAEFTRIPNARGTIYAAAFSPDGTTIALASFEEGLQLFDASTLRPIGVPVHLGLFVSAFTTGVRWTDDGTGVWVAPSRGPIRISADPERWIEMACEISGRELTAEEWATFVSPDSDPIPACQAN